MVAIEPAVYYFLLAGTQVGQPENANAVPAVILY